MVAHVGAQENRQVRAPLGGIVLLVLGALLCAIHVDLADFAPEPYGTLPIDGSDAEFFAPAGGSPALIFAVSALLLLGRNKELQRALGQPARWMLACGLLGLGGGISRWADYVQAPALLVPGLILLLLGAGVLLGGSRGLRAISIPALFLVFAIPIPAGFVNLIVWPLQQTVAWFTEWFLRLAGYAPERFADVVVLEGHRFQVIETCSGMRTTETLVMAGVLYTILFYRRPGQAAVIILLAPLVGFLANLVRVLSIVVNPYAQWGAVHAGQGIAMLVVGVLSLAGIDHLLLRRERHLGLAPRALRQTAWSSPPNQPIPWPRAIGLGCFLLLLAVANLAIPAWQPVEPPRLGAFALPHEIAGSKPRGLKLDRQFLGSVGIRHWLHREYTFEGNPVRILILADDRLDRRGALLSPKTAIPGRGSVELSHEIAPLGDGTWVDRHVFASHNRRTLVYHWYEGMRSPLEESLRNALALDRGPTRRNTWALAVRLSTPLAEEPDSVSRADARLRGFAREIRMGL